MFAYNPTVNDRSGEILGAGQMQAAATNAQAMSQMGQDIGGALASLGGSIGTAMGENKMQKNMFEGNYRFLTERNMLPSNIQNAALDLIGKKNYAAANAYIAPYLAELDYGRKAMLAGRSGFFDGSGQWQMAMPAQAVNPPNKEGYVYRSR